MSELLYRLLKSPVISAELLVASLFINILALASTLYVISVLNRYLAYGVNETLITLTLGVIFAIILEFLFRRIRLSLAELIGLKRNLSLFEGAVGLLVEAKIQALETYPKVVRKALIANLSKVERAYNANNLSNVLDVPFAFLFIIVLLIISPLLGAISLLFVVIIIVFSIIHQRLMRNKLLEINEVSLVGNEYLDTVNQANETIRSFDLNNVMLAKSVANNYDILEQRRNITNKESFLQHVTLSLQALISVSIYATGAVLILRGVLDVGSLIGANILATRALSTIAKLTNISESFIHANQAIKELKQFALLEAEQKSGVILPQYAGKLEVKGVSFAHRNSEPLFDSLAATLTPGTVMVVTGDNGAGKTTFAKIIAGLLTPSHGVILIDGVDARQIDKHWWRKQLTYLPQEPLFLNMSIKDNLLAANPDLTTDDLTNIIKTAGLKAWIDQTPEGIDKVIENQGLYLAIGQRRRLALARALAINGPLVMMDEPTEGLDQAGKRVVYELLIELSRQQRAIILCTQDQHIIKGANIIIDLNDQ